MSAKSVDDTSQPPTLFLTSPLHPFPVLRAASLGGVHSVANKPTSLSHVYLTQQEKEAANITDNLVRLSVGLENTGDIINDLDRALRAAVLKEKVES